MAERPVWRGIVSTGEYAWASWPRASNLGICGMSLPQSHAPIVQENVCRVMLQTSRYSNVFNLIWSLLWFISLFCICACVNAMQWVFYHHIPQAQVRLLSDSSQWDFYGPVNWPCVTWWGIRTVIILCESICMCDRWIRFLFTASDPSWTKPAPQPHVLPFEVRKWKRRFRERVLVRSEKRGQSWAI